MKYKYFSNTDFETATPSCQISDMDEDFVHLLDTARGLAGIPFIINSAYRTVEYEKNKGRDGTSSHTKGIAVDIAAETSRSRFLILDALHKTGFHRMGIGKTFIHVDCDSSKDSKVIWDYYE